MNEVYFVASSICMERVQGSISMRIENSRQPLVGDKNIRCLLCNFSGGRVVLIGAFMRPLVEKKPAQFAFLF